MSSHLPVLYIAGTGQHSGKTLVSLGLTMALRAAGLEARYMKPVGQRTVSMDGKLVDEDVALMISACHLRSTPEAASPITLPSGFTRDFLMHGGSVSDLEQRIRDGFAEVADGADIVIAEGTGHAGVGSVVDLSNARVAALLGAEVIIVTSGGIGKPIDELCLNQALFAREGVPIFGVVFNKVLASKMKETREPVYAWAEHHGQNVLGMIPYDGLLSKITVAQIAEETGAMVHSGQSSLGCLIEKFIVGAESPHRFLAHFGPGVLALIPGDREDLVLAAVSAAHTAVSCDGRSSSAICLTSGILPHPNTMAIVKRTSIPLIAVEEGMFRAASRISDLVAKMTAAELEKVDRAQEIVSTHLDFSRLEERLGICIRRPSEKGNAHVGSDLRPAQT
ncbi:MAG: AAA family ATPase [Armatimonadetes bacterium]|nr:AAA family ATPase [Armatimonadota bacterium]